MDEGQYEQARNRAAEHLTEMLDEAHAVAGIMDGQEVRIEQRVTLETSGSGHAKWNRRVDEFIFELTDEELAEFEAES